MIDGRKAALQAIDHDRLVAAVASRNLEHVTAETAPAFTAMKHAIGERSRKMVMSLFVQSARAATRDVRRFGPANVAKAAAAGMRVAADPFTFSFDATNEEAVKWAEDHAGEMLDNMAEADAVNAIMTEAMMDQVAPEQIVGMIESVIGLDERRAAAVENLRVALMDADPGDTVSAGAVDILVPDEVTDDFLDEKTDAYAGRLLNQRASMISRTETAEISDAGQQALWNQALSDGLLSNDTEEREWIVTDDDALCDECKDYDGDRAPIDDVFEASGLDGPPAHTGCRCAEGLVAKDSSDEGDDSEGDDTEGGDGE